MTSEIEVRPYGNQRYTLPNTSIVVIVGSGDMRRPAIDEWAELMIETINTFPHPPNSTLLLDITNPAQGFTPYASTKANDVLNAVKPGRHVVLAILFQNTLIYEIINVFLNRAKIRADIFDFQAFTDREKAIEWLNTQQNAIK